MPRRPSESSQHKRRKILCRTADSLRTGTSHRNSSILLTTSGARITWGTVILHHPSALAHSPPSFNDANAQPMVCPPNTDDFDLPTTDFDSDNDEARAVPKRNDDEKWVELCLDEFLNPRRHPARGMQ